MGMWGGYFFIFIRACICIIWYGIQSYYGGNLLAIMLRCIFGSTYTRWPNALPASAHVTSQQLLCFFLVWLLEFPFTWVHPTRIQYLFTVKGILMPAAAFGLFGWCMAHGAGIASIHAADGTAPDGPAALGWSIMSGINVVLGLLSPMLVNQPDLARYTKHPRDAGWPQGVCCFVAQLLVFFLGLAATTSMQGAWGEAYWNPWDLLDAILDHYEASSSSSAGATARAGCFFVALSFLLGVVATNLGCNSIPFGADMTGLFPRFLTIRRGQILCAVLGVAVVPWELIAGAEAFLSFLGSYNIFMAPLCAVIIVDYVYARKGNLHVPSLYDGSRTGLYWFTGGVNLLGVFAWCAGTVMGLPGLVGQYQPQLVSQAALNMYKLGWVLTFVTAAGVYAACVTFVKPRIVPEGREVMGREWLANEGREGFLEDEREDILGVGEGVEGTRSGSVGGEKSAGSGKEEGKEEGKAEV